MAEVSGMRRENTVKLQAFSNLNKKKGIAEKK
jgi:hypothetical protein